MHEFSLPLGFTGPRLDAAFDVVRRCRFNNGTDAEAGQDATNILLAVRDYMRQSSPEFLVKVVDECAANLDKREFSKEQEAWIVQVSVVQTELAKQQLRVARAAQNAGNAASIAEQENEAFATMTKNFSLLWEQAPL